MKKGTKITLWVVTLVVVILITLIALGLDSLSNPRVINRLLFRYVPDYAAAVVTVEDVDVTVFSSYPDVQIELAGVRVATPALDSVKENVLVYDTLLRLDTLRLSLCLPHLLKRDVKVNELLLSSPRLNIAERKGKYNFDILVPQENDTTESEPYRIQWDKVNLTDGIILVSSDSLDLYDLQIDSIYLSSCGQFTDSLLEGDASLALRLEDATVELAGSLRDTVAARAVLSVPYVENLLALLPDALRKRTIKENTLSGGINVKAQCAMPNARLQEILADTCSTMMDKLKASGIFVQAKVAVDSLHGGHPKRKIQLDNLSLRAEARYDAKVLDSSFVRVDTLRFNSGSSWISASGLGAYKRAREWMRLNLQAKLYLKELAELTRMDTIARVRGQLRANVQTSFYLDDLLKRKVYDIHSESDVKGDDVFVAVRGTRMGLFADSLRIHLTTNMERVSKRTGKKDTALLDARLAFRQIKVRYRRNIKAELEGARVFLYADDLTDHTVPRLHAMLSMEGVDVQRADSLRMLAQKLRVSGSMRPDKKAAFVPATTARISLDSVFFIKPRNGMLLDSVRMNLTAVPRFRRFYRDSVSGERVAIPDSDRKIMTLDSLLRLGQTVLADSAMMETYYKRFANTGKVYVRTLGLRHKGDDLRPTVRRMDITLNDDTLTLNSFRMRIGRSMVSLKGDVHHLRRYLIRGKTLDANLELESPRIDLNQLSQAWQRQQRRRERLDSIALAENMSLLEDSLQFAQSSQANDTLLTDGTSYESVDSLATSLIVLPNNLNVRFRAKVDTVIFSGMRLHEFKGQIRLNDQTLAITNLSTSTKVGKMRMNLVYACRDTLSAHAAADLSMDSVQIGDLVKALPELDSVMPMLRSFDGSVACDAAARLKLNRDMSIDLPSVNACAWLRGTNMVLLDGETFSEIAKMLMFSKKTRNVIDSLSVEVMVENNKVQIFPFMLTIDKYYAGVGGTQNLDGSFNYHISLFKPLKIALDVYGTDFKHIKFNPFVKAKYKSARSKAGDGRMLLRDNDAAIIPNFRRSVRQYIYKVSK